MTVRFRTARYLLALLWHWSVPFMLGAVAAFCRRLPRHPLNR